MRIEKDARVAAEGTLSAKVSLTNYFSNTQDQTNGAKLSSTAGCLAARKDAVRRNLDSEINSSPKNENEDLTTLTKRDHQTPEAMKIVQREPSQGSSNAVNDAMKGLTKDFLVARPSVENPELKQFANEFLSLYCRYCISNVAVYL